MKVSNIDLNTVIRHSEDIDATDLNGDKVMMNLQKGQYFALNDIGSRIWDIISSRITVRDIINTLLKEYDVDAEVCEETVMSFLGKLKDAELIIIN